MREVAVIGVGLQKWGELWEKSLRQIYVEAASNAIKDAGVDHIDSMYIGSMSGGLFAAQEHLASMMADYLGVLPVAAARVESACASGGLAMKLGWMEVASGLSDVVLVSGVEKMHDITGDEATFALSTAADTEYEGYQGVTFPGLYAMMARAHMAKYGTTIEQLSHVSVKNHANAAHNPDAQYPFAVTLEQVMTSTMVADPLRLFHCSPLTDGAAALMETSPSPNAWTTCGNVRVDSGCTPGRSARAPAPGPAPTTVRILARTTLSPISGRTRKPTDSRKPTSPPPTTRTSASSLSSRADLWGPMPSM